MGEETRQLATRFSAALELLARVAAARAPRGKRGSPGGDPAAAMRRALDILEEVYRAQTGALRGWAEQRARALAQHSAVRAALDRPGDGAERLAISRGEKGGEAARRS